MAANSTQQERFATMLGELHMSGKEFADRTGLSEVSVSRWRNGTRSIQAGAALQIEATFPQFSADWIRGSSPYRNDIEASAFGISGRAGRLYLTNHENVAVAINLAARNGYSVKLPNENVEQDGTGRAVCDATIAHLTMNGGISVRGSDGSAKNPPVMIEHDGVTAEITVDALEDFANELEDFAAVRLSRIFSKASATDSTD